MVLVAPIEADLRIGLINDDAHDRFLVREGLSALPQKVAVIEYTNSEDALAAMVEGYEKGELPAEFLAFDINMPMADGFGLMGAFMAHHFTGVPLILLTSADDPDMHKKAEALGANAVLPKSMDKQAQETLTRLIVEFWARRH